jgi:anti-anti-sigma regulatory factor
MRQVFDDCVRSGTNIVLDFQKTEYIDGAFMGLLLLFEKDLQNNSNNLTFININDRLTKIFDLFCFQKQK